MQKFTVPIDPNTETKDCMVSRIKETLIPILQWYDPHNHSDLYYIKIYITKTVYMVVKMIKPFNSNTSSYAIYSYMTTGQSKDFEQMVFSMSINNTHQLDITSEALSKIIVEFISVDKPNNILVVTNMDSQTEREQRGFMHILDNNKSDEENFIDFVYYLGQTLNDRVNYALMRLNIDIDPDTDDHISGVYEIMIHSSKVFNRMVYDVSFSIPQMPLDPIFGLSFQELLQVLEQSFYSFNYFGETICINNDTYKISYYVIKKEVAY